MSQENTSLSFQPGKLKMLDEKSVHHLRKSTKQLRARLHLFREIEGHRKNTEDLRQAVKELASLLSSQRDADVMAGLLQELRDESADIALQELLDSLGDNLQTRQLPDSEIKRIRHLAREIDKAVHNLLSKQLPEPQLEEVLEKRLRLLCVTGAELLNGTDWEALHDWRKQVKRLMYQYGMKHSHTPKDFFVLEHLDALGDHLGRIHDFQVLEKYVHEQEKTRTRARVLELFNALYSRIDTHRETELQACRQLFAEISNLQ